MVLADTSVWIDHFRHGSEKLNYLLREGQVLCHPFVIGELACGNLRNRAEILRLLGSLPQAPHFGPESILAFIEDRKLSGLGIGLIDVHLLGGALLAHADLWTEDKRLKTAAHKLKIAF